MIRKHMTPPPLNTKVEVCFSPHLYDVYRNNESVVVIIDILRATSAICTAFHHEVKEIIPVATIEEANEYRDKGFLIGGERNGVKIEGFDFGNSPYDYMNGNIKGKTIVLTTTNGTQAINMAKDAYKVVIGSFLNYTTLCNWLLAQRCRVTLLCSGWKDRFNLEDSLFAGAVTSRLSKDPFYSELSDGALAAKYIYESASGDPFRLLRNSSHRRRLAALNLKQDIKYCLQLDKTDVIPLLHNGKTIVLENGSS